MPLGKKVRKEAARSPFEIVSKNAFAMGVDVQVQFYRVPYICAKFALEIRLHVVESREHNNEGPARDTGRHNALGQVGDPPPRLSVSSRASWGACAVPVGVWSVHKINQTLI